MKRGCQATALSELLRRQMSSNALKYAPKASRQALETLPLRWKDSWTWPFNVNSRQDLPSLSLTVR